MPCFAFPNGDIYGNAYATDCYWRCAFAITEIAAPNKSLNRTASTWRKGVGLAWSISLGVPRGRLAPTLGVKKESIYGFF